MERSGWSVRSTDGYCPRCNAKARHRRLWLFLRDHTDMLASRARVLEVGPAPAFATLFSRRRDVDYVSIGTNRDIPRQSVVADVKALPFAEQSFDVAICQHVLEHVDDDKSAMAEIRRVVRSDGWAVISVPLGTSGTTEEDPLLTDPAEQKRRFGEIGHLRVYGSDITERLNAAGFDVTVHRAELIDDELCARHGLRKDEHLFVCTQKARPRT
jgi:SAM-dependent methyltransferase